MTKILHSAEKCVILSPDVVFCSTVSIIVLNLSAKDVTSDVSDLYGSK